MLFIILVLGHPNYWEDNCREWQREVGLGRNDEVAMMIQKGGRKGEFSGWILMNEKETLAGWERVHLFGPLRW